MRVTAGLPTADDPAVPVGELRQQIEIFVIDIHRPRSLAVNVERIALGDLLNVLVSLVDALNKNRSLKVVVSFRAE